MLEWLGRIPPAFCPSQALMVQDSGCCGPLTTPTRLQVLWGPQKEPESPLPVPIGLAELLSHLVTSLPTSWWEALLPVFASLWAMGCSDVASFPCSVGFELLCAEQLQGHVPTPPRQGWVAVSGGAAGPHGVTGAAAACTCVLLAHWQ